MEHRRHALDRLRKELPLTNDSEPARSLRDQHIAAGKKRDGPRLHERVDHGDHAIVVKRRPHEGIAGYDRPTRQNQDQSRQAPQHSEHRSISSAARAAPPRHYWCPCSPGQVNAQRVSFQGRRCLFTSPRSPSSEISRLSRGSDRKNSTSGRSSVNGGPSPMNRRSSSGPAEYSASRSPNPVTPAWPKASVSAGSASRAR